MSRLISVCITRFCACAILADMKIQITVLLTALEKTGFFFFFFFFLFFFFFFFLLGVLF